MTATLTNDEIDTRASETVLGDDYLLLEAIIAGLRHSGYRSLTNLQCEVYGGQVIISGVVPSYFLKQVAQTIILRIGLVKGMKNHLQVNPVEYGL